MNHQQTTVPAGSQNHTLTGFVNYATPSARILILGSMPGNRSLQENEYYAHPRNVFWDILENLFDVNRSVAYQCRIEQLTALDIALWDVIKQCQRKGSLDTDITASSVVPNDFRSFYRQYPSIQHVFFNGKKSSDLYRKHVLPILPGEIAPITYHTLPSTSPANAAMSFTEKIQRWKLIKDLHEKREKS